MMDRYTLDAAVPPFYAMDGFIPTVIVVIMILALITGGVIFFVKKAKKDNSRDDIKGDGESKG